MEMYHGQLFVGGYDSWGNITDTILIRWDGKQWHHIIGPNSSLSSLKVYNDTLYLGGGFTQIGNDTSIKWIAKYSTPWENNCDFLQPIIETMHSLSAPNGVANTFYYSDSVKVQFYNNIQSAATWQWNFGDGDTGTGQTPNHYYNIAGTYNVSVIVSYPWGPNGTCIDTTSKSITVLHSNSTEKYSKENLNFKLYPNPTNGDITIELTLLNSIQAELRSFNINGNLQNIYPLQIGSNKIIISANNLTNGISIVSLYIDNKQVFEEKVMKK